MLNVQEFNFNELFAIDLKQFQSEQKQVRSSVAAKLRQICKTSGFFYLKNHQIPEQLINSLIQCSKQFFSLPKGEKEKIHLRNSGPNFKGYFSKGEQFTGGKADIKEGIYLSQQLDDNHPLVVAKTPLHGRNQFPETPKEFKGVVLEYLTRMEALGHKILRLIAASLHLPQDYFEKSMTKNPYCQFSIFDYPPDKTDSWGVAQHTDYGMITILLVTGPGLQVKNRKDQWVKADRFDNCFIVNIGDMLERLTRGLYRSTPHRVRNDTPNHRLGMPFCFDPGWQSIVEQIDIIGFC